MEKAKKTQKQNSKVEFSENLIVSYCSDLKLKTESQSYASKYTHVRVDKAIKNFDQLWVQT